MLPAPFTILLIRSPWFQRWSVIRQKSPFWRLYFNDREGALLHTEHGGPISVNPDHVYLIPQETPFSGDSTGPLRHGFIHFHASWKADPGIYPIPLDGRLRSLRNRLLQKDGEPAHLPELTFHAYRFIFEVFNRIDPSKRRPNPDETLLQPALSLIQNRLREGIDSETLARISGMNVNRFIRTFRTTYGLTPHRYLMVRRCEEAAARIEQTDATLETIAEETGFCDRYHLTKVFRQLRGTTPAAYRRSFRREDSGRS